MSLAAEICTLRPYRSTDVERLAELAGDFDVARYMADRYPYPYTIEDARWWTSTQAAAAIQNNFAIEYGGELAGGIGLEPYSAEKRRTAAIGYWVARPYWGRGIATAAIRTLTRFALNERDFIRLEATVYSPNAGSMRVLEKCGYSLEGIMRKAIVKRGEILDAHIYAKVRE